MKQANISSVIRYEQQLKSKMQQTQNVILNANHDRSQLKSLRLLIEEQQQLLKYLEVESSSLQEEVRKLYSRNITRFKKKIKEHKEYVNTRYGQGAISTQQDPYQIRQKLQVQQQNMQFMSQKRQMYDNQMLQQEIGRDIHRQGFYLENNIDRNKDIRKEAEDASDNVSLIKKAIFKRKFMFFSLIILTLLAVGFVLVKKIAGIVM